MRRDTAEVSEAARRRLEALGRELDAEDDSSAPAGALQETLVPGRGRHARAAPRRGTGPWVEMVRDRFAWTPAHLAVVAVLVSAALALVAWSVLRSAPRQIAAPASPRPDAPSGPMLVSAPQATSAGEVVVDIAGKVRRPGVATLPAGARVVDALRHAGGARRGVDLSTLNLARPLVDGEQVLVGVAPVPGQAAGAVRGPAPGRLVNLNTASPEDLDHLPGVGPVTAQKIVAWRTEHGPFTAVDELLDVDGIGSKTLAELAPHVTL